MARRRVRAAQGNRPASAATDSAATAATVAASAIEPVALLAPASFSGVPFMPLPDSLTLAWQSPVAALPQLADSLPRRLPLPAVAYRLRLGLMLAPEVSTVRAERLTTPGTNVGLQLEYRLSQRWRLNVAYLRAVKRYVANAGDYHPPDGYWPQNLKLTEVNADCRMIDIPLNLRYDLWQRPTHQVFVSAGLSSLLMRRELYTYDYLEAGQAKRADWELLNGSNHALQILNLSAGYERAVGGRWTVQAEPFVKLPLGGVGFGAVRLSSAGVFFSLKYGLGPQPAAMPPAAR